MVGEIEMMIAGHRLVLLADGDRLQLLIPSFRTAYFMVTQKLPLDASSGLLRASRRKLTAQIGPRARVRLFPQPPLLLKLASPAIRALNGRGS